MRGYTFHLPAGAIPGEPAAVERAVIVRDGFSWPAFLFSALWCFWHRLWLAGLGVLVGFAVLVAAGMALDLRPGAAVVAVLLACALVGLEASSLRRWTLARRGRPEADVVTARSRLEAEAKLVARALSGTDPAPRPPVASYRPPPTPVIGLFPDAERGR